MDVPATIKNVLRNVRRTMFTCLGECGIFKLVARTRWRQRRLLILCYHGISLDDEHLWRPNLYMRPELLEQRLKQLRLGGYNVLPLGQAIERLIKGILPARSVALTFDDGGYDFYRQAFPLLQEFGFSATVYQTTYYVDHPAPIFPLICSYMLFKRRGAVIDAPNHLGVGTLDLRTETARERVVVELLRVCQENHFGEIERTALATSLAQVLEIDYPRLLSQRILQLMSPLEIAELAAKGVDFQLHTHRHRTPSNELQFRQEIAENRERLAEITNSTATHFCYPSGIHEPRFLPWLRAERVASATTCDPGFAISNSDPLCLPRFVDTSSRTASEYEAWLSGFGSWIRIPTSRNGGQRKWGGTISGHA